MLLEITLPACPEYLARTALSAGFIPFRHAGAEEPSGYIQINGYLLLRGGGPPRFLFREAAAKHVAALLSAETYTPEILGEIVSQRLNGGFSITVVYTGVGGLCVCLAGDRFGNSPLYGHLSGSGGRLIVGDRAADVACRAGAPLNVAAALALAAMEFVPGRQTLAGGVEEVKPGELWVYTLDSATPDRSISRYWQPQVRPRGISDERELESRLAALLDEIADDWSTALAAMLPGEARVALPLSGGMDSRLLTALFHERLAERAVAVCYGDPASEDVQLSRRAAKLIGIEHRHLPYVDGSLISGENRRVLAEEIGLTTRLTLADGGRGLADLYGMMNPGPGHDVGVFLPGHSGDGLTGSRMHAGLMSITDPVREISDIIGHSYWKCFPAGETAGLLRREHADLARAPRALTGESLRQLEADNPAECLQNWLISDLVHRRVLTECILYRRTSHPMTPFFDYRLADFYNDLPAALVYNQRLYMNTILGHVFTGKKATLGQLEIQGRGVPSRVGERRSKHTLSHLPRRIRNQVLRRMAPDRYERRTSSCPMVSLYRHDGALRESIRKDLRNAVILPRIYDMDRLTAWLEPRLGKDYFLTSLGIWGLLTIEHAGKTFLR